MIVLFGLPIFLAYGVVHHTVGVAIRAGGRTEVVGFPLVGDSVAVRVR